MPRRSDDTNIWKALANQVRRDLIVFIGEKGIVSFTEIRDRFNMKVGTLYHHLDTLGELISQDQNKYYYLTERGKRAYALIEDEIDVSAHVPKTGVTVFLHNLLLRPLFEFFSIDAVRSLGFSLLIFAGLCIVSYYLTIGPVFLFPTFVTPSYFAPIFLIVSTLILYILSDLALRLIFGRKQGKLALLQGIILIQIPLTLFSLAFYYGSSSSYPVYPWEMEVWLFVLFLFVQTYCLGLLVESYMVIKELRLEKAGFVALLITYLLNFFAFIIMNYFGGT
ncbi:MAG: winged helix-turn-helix domain-containing protein [Candidatus Heimdallarchaeaceae archaeon]